MEGMYILINVLFIITYFICDKIIFRTCIFYTFLVLERMTIQRVEQRVRDKKL